MNYGKVMLVFFSMISMGIYAQETQLLFNLDEAQSYALLHNKTLLNATKDVLIARESYRETLGAGLPQVNGSLDYMTYFNYEFALDFGGGGGNVPPIDPTYLDLGDTTILGFIGRMNGSSGPTTIVMGDQASANLQITQLIFSGQYWVGLQMAKIGKRIAQTGLEMTSLGVKENVASTYYLVLVTRELVNIIGNNQKNMEEILKHTSDMYTVGLAEQTDVDQFRITVSQLENTRRSMERNLQLNMNMLRFVMGIEKDQEIELTDSLEALIGRIDETVLLKNEFDMTLNPTYNLLAAQQEIGRKSVDLQRWSYAPTIAGFYSYKEKILATAFDLSPKHAAGVSLTVPIFEGGTKRASLSKAKIELDKMNRNMDMLEEQLALQDRQLQFELNSAWDNYTTQKENVEVARRMYNNMHNKYNQGMVSSLDLTQANSNFLQAESNYVSATLNLLQAKLQQDKLYNRL
jgi:outer membrane protein